VVVVMVMVMVVMVVMSWSLDGPSSSERQAS
jgi:hypothetical protein